MRVLQVHESYQQPGGEDRVVAAEAALLRARGHEVAAHTVHNDEVDVLGRLALAGKTVWNRSAYRAVRRAVREHRTEVMHVHNTLPLLSPAVYHAAWAEGVSVVQTLHNYRLLCPAATLYRDGGVCEDCVGKPLAWPAVVHGCYRGSRAASGAVATMVATHRLLGTWSRRIDVFIALTEFARSRFVHGGLDEARLAVKPNFVDVPAPEARRPGGYALFVGRLAPEKGLAVLLDAWRRIGERLPLRIVGDGPLASEAERATRELPGVRWLGARSREEVLDAMRDAELLVFPSTWYEGFPVTLAEAFASGLPVLASELGSLAELVENGRTGLTFPPGDAEALADRVVWTLDHPRAVDAMRHAARETYERRYSPDANYRQLVAIYRRAQASRKEATSSTAPDPST